MKSKKNTNDISKITDEERLRTALSILRKWKCTEHQIRNILGRQKNICDKLIIDSGAIEHSKEQNLRVYYLLEIHAALKIVFSNPDNIYDFMNMKNNNAFFNGSRPIALIEKGNFDNLENIYKRVVSMSSGSI